jgi:hypothetical protein
MNKDAKLFKGGDPQNHCDKLLCEQVKQNFYF